MSRCEVCEGKAEKTCGYEYQPMLDFCTEHFIEHLGVGAPAKRRSATSRTHITQRTQEVRTRITNELERLRAIR